MTEPAITTKMSIDEGKSVDSPMEAQVEKLAQKVWKKFQSLDESQRYLIGIAGIPGSGKSTFAASLAYHLNSIYSDDYLKKYPNAADYGLSRPRSHTNGSSHRRNTSDTSDRDIAFVLPMDGYHLTREQLSAMPNAEEAHYRRGAAFTFDAEGYFKLVEKLRKAIEPGSRTVWAPSFDHAIKDPVQDDISIPRTARVVIIEGLYVGLTYPPSENDDSDKDSSKKANQARWTEASELLDEIWLISVPIPVATERVAKRNFKAGLSPSLEAALKRTVENDMQNAREILDHLPGEAKLTERIESIEDEGWKSEEQRQALRAEKDKLEEEARELDIKRLRLERMGSIAEMVDDGAGM